MRILFALLILLTFVSNVYADEFAARRHASYPQGTFKKSRSGKILQYDKNGKKIGEYNINSRKYKK